MSSKKLPRVVICGRTNVGKSTLFNRLAETKKAIVSDLAGTTRDRNFAKVAWQNKEFELIDTGGLDIFDEPELEQNIKKQIQIALQQASVVIFVMDGKMDLLPQDKEIAKNLLELKKPVVLAINKIDSLKDQHKVDADVHKLKFKHSQICSGLNGLGTGDLLDVITDLLPKQKLADEEKESTKIAIIGQPNVGKSSLLNAIIGEERVVVSEIAHTTRDINDVEFQYGKDLFVLIDTAGLRRKARVGKWKGEGKRFLAKIEKEGVGSTINAIREADIVLLVLEVHKRINAQDKAIVQTIVDEGKSLILVLNKWDLIPEKDAATIKKYEKYFYTSLPFATWAPIIMTSAKTKQRVKKVLDLALKVKENQEREIPEEEIADLREHFFNKYKPKQKQTITHGQQKKPLKLGRFEQIDTKPPTFYIHSKNPKMVAPSLVKIIEKMFRQKYDFKGTPIKLIVEK